MHRPAIEPVSIAWQATILPLNPWCLTICNIFRFFQTCHLFQVSFLGCSVFVESSIYRALLFLLIVQKTCIDRQSNPCLSRGRRQIYHRTIDAWQIATITGSFYTCNRIHIGFSGCSLCKLNVQIIEFSRFCWLFKNVHRPGIEPGSIAWQATILPLNHWCSTNWNTFWFFQTCHLFQVSFLGCSVFLKSSIYRALPILLIVQKMCIDQQSNPFLSRGRRQFYHWTLDAWQFATFFGSFRHAIYFKSVFYVALCLLKVQFTELSCFCWLFKKRASTGNRTLVYRVAGDKSTTEPSMLDKLQQLLVPFIHAIVFTLVFQVALCVSWMFKLSSSPVFVDCSKMCIDRESNPGLSRGRRQFYHWTIYAWQIATITGSFRTCNLFQVGFPGCSVFVESSIYRALLFLLIVQKMCIDRQSKPCLSRGRRQIYHWTIDAWQIATITRSFCTCNRIHISFSGCSLCKLNVQIIEFSRFCLLFKNVHRPGIEPLSIAWQATNLPLNHRCLTNCNNYWFLSYMQSISCWFSKLLCVCWKFNLPSSSVFVDCSKNVHRLGIEPGSIAWQATILPLNHRCLTNCNNYWFLSYMQSFSSWFSRLLCVCWKFNLSSSPVFVDCSKNVHRPAIEPLSIVWQATNLPPNHRCLTNCNNYWFRSYVQLYSPWFFRLLSVSVECSNRVLPFLLIVQNCTSTRNRTLFYRVAGDNSTTEPLMLDKLEHFLVLSDMPSISS